MWVCWNGNHLAVTSSDIYMVSCCRIDVAMGRGRHKDNPPYEKEKVASRSFAGARETRKKKAKNVICNITIEIKYQQPKRSEEKGGYDE